MTNTSGFNVRGWLAFALPALLPVATWAAPLVLEAPTEVPATATAPALNPQPDPALATGRILLFPFQADNPADANAWMGKSIQESLVADLTVMAPDRVMSIDQPAGTLENTIAVARQRGAKFVIAGGFATSAGELRITGQILNIETGKPVGAIKVTGDPSQIFRMEDGLAMQIKGQLMPGQEPAAPQQPAQPQVQQPQQLPFPGQVPAANDANATPPNYPVQTPIYSTYATPPTPPVYGTDGYYPYSDTSAVYPYAYPAYSSVPYCDYGYYPYYGLGVGFYYGGRFNHFHDNRFSSRSFTGVRSGATFRGGSSFHTGTAFRSPSISTRSSFSAGGLHVGASFHSSGGSFHIGSSSHGGGGFSHGGGGHGGHR